MICNPDWMQCAKKRDALQKRLLDPDRAFREHMQRGVQLAQIIADTA